MISKVRERIEGLKGKKIRFKYNGSRNQIEEFDGIIMSTYNAIFTIKTLEEKERIKSFTYSDVLINNLEIYN